MDLITVTIFAVALAIVVYKLQASRSTAVVPEQYRVEVPDGGITAIEYFWRPG